MASRRGHPQPRPRPEPHIGGGAGGGGAAIPTGAGPVVVLKSRLGGWTQDQLEVGDILDQYGLKTLYAFNVDSRTRGIAIRFHPRNGRSLLPYDPGSTVFLHGEPKDSLLKPITKVMVGVAAMTVVIAVLIKETTIPDWLRASRLGSVNFVLACMVIVFMRLRKRKKLGW